VVGEEEHQVIVIDHHTFISTRNNKEVTVRNVVLLSRNERGIVKITRVAWWQQSLGDNWTLAMNHDGGTRLRHHTYSSAHELRLAIQTISNGVLTI